tara:strand:+ start:196 stop:399 length:204 start_codon:yes stop_codon:yes gene_type:complete
MGETARKPRLILRIFRNVTQKTGLGKKARDYQNFPNKQHKNTQKSTPKLTSGDTIPTPVRGQRIQQT